jgi:RNA polymerase sigma factor (sigma-70 family)
MDLPPFQTLLDHHSRELWRFLAASVGPIEADDCIQETWLSALRAYPRLSSADNLRGWLFTIAHRKALDAHRARARRATPMAEPPEVAAPAAPEPRDEELWDSVRALPGKQRAAVMLRFTADLDYAEIGAVIDCSPEAARRSVHEGLTRMRGDRRA